MSATFSYILLHIVFSTKRREAWITPDIKPRLYDFIGGIIRAENGGLLAIGGVEDHVHLLVRWNTDKSVGDLMRNVKARSSMWVHQTFPGLREFAWQSGYGAFSVSDARADAVSRYIERQEEHHRTSSFLEEFEGFLKTCGIKYEREWLQA